MRAWREGVVDCKESNPTQTVGITVLTDASGLKAVIFSPRKEESHLLHFPDISRGC